MNDVNDAEFESKEDILKRLRRIEGQVKGIQRLINEEKKCTDILTQVAAVRAAINKVGSIILSKHSMTCLESVASTDDKQKAMKELAKTMQSFMRFID